MSRQTRLPSKEPQPPKHADQSRGEEAGGSLEIVLQLTTAAEDDLQSPRFSEEALKRGKCFVAEQKLIMSWDFHPWGSDFVGIKPGAWEPAGFSTPFSLSVFQFCLQGPQRGAILLLMLPIRNGGMGRQGKWKEDKWKESHCYIEKHFCNQPWVQGTMETITVQV